MLVGARHPGATVGAVEKEYRSEVSCFCQYFFFFLSTLLLPSLADNMRD